MPKFHSFQYLHLYGHDLVWHCYAVFNISFKSNALNSSLPLMTLCVCVGGGGGAIAKTSDNSSFAAKSSVLISSGVTAK